MGIPDHPEIACALRTGYPRPYKSVRCEDCGSEMSGSHRMYIDNGDVLCGSCLKARILDEYTTDDLADAFDVQKTTAHDYFENIDYG